MGTGPGELGTNVRPSSSMTNDRLTDCGTDSLTDSFCCSCGFVPIPCSQPSVHPSFHPSIYPLTTNH